MSGRLLLFIVIVYFSIATYANSFFTPACSKYSDPPPGGWKKWSNPSTWASGIVPGINGRKINVNIPCDTGVILDTSITVDQLVVEGSLRVVDKGPFQVNANFVVVKGMMNIGTVGSPYEGRITFNLTNGGYEYTITGNATLGIKAFIVLGGSVEFNGMYGNQEAWTTLTKTAEAGSRTLSLKGDVSKWPINGNIAIASTDYNYKQAEQKIIKAISYASGVTTITLDSPLSYMHWGDRLSTGIKGVYISESAEVTLLSRTITIQGSQEQNHDIGGHFVVFKTQTKQSIIGLELTNMGQQGTLGRYPMHFHLSQDVTGSYIKKCSVHHSNQRCYVVHGTFNLLLDGNSAYNTKGHCYFLEDGIEHGNTFSNNLGFYQESPAVSPMGDTTATISDGSPSTFWISNPDNTWINNVAGGSSDSGYWFQLAGGVQGPSAGFPGAASIFPHFLPLRKFAGNVAHSNMRAGLRTYSDGFRPRAHGGVKGNGGPINAPNARIVISNFKAYKNAMDGMFIHESDSILIDGGFFADNRVVGIELHQVEEVFVQNAIILGETANIGNPSNCQDAGNGYANCEPLVGSCSLPADTSKSRSLGAGQTPRDIPMFGILIDQSEYPSHGLTVLGNSNGAPYPQRIQNVTFGMFNNRCKVSAAITANGHTQNAMFLASHGSKRLRFVDNTPRIYLAPRVLGILGFETPNDAGPTSASYVFRDIDGTLMGNRNPGYIVTADTPQMLPAKKGACTQLKSGNAWACPGTCYRTVGFTLGGISTSSPNFTIVRVSDKVSYTIQGYPTSFLNLLAGTLYDITISPTPSSVKIWYADPLGCSRSALFRVKAPSGMSWDESGGSWMACSGSAQDLASQIQLNEACFNGERTPTLQVIMGGKTKSTLTLTLSKRTQSCSTLKCGLISSKSAWLYNDNGPSQLASDWSTSSKAGSTWSAGIATFGFGGSDVVTPVYTASKMGGVTWYFKTTFGYSAQPCLESLVLGVILNDGVMVFINGKEVYQANMPSTLITPSTLALKSYSDWRAPNYTTATIPIAEANLKAGVNTVAVEVHAFSEFAWNMRFDMHMSATGTKCNGPKMYAAKLGVPRTKLIFPAVVR